MKKTFLKIKNKVLLLLSVLLTSTSQLRAMVQPEYGIDMPPVQALYGVSPTPEPSEVIYRIIMFLGLPLLILLALIIGTIVLIKRRRRKKKFNAKKDSKNRAA